MPEDCEYEDEEQERESNDSEPLYEGICEGEKIGKHPLEQLRKEVGEWSQANFGDQESKALSQRRLEDHGWTELPIILGSMAPMFGLIEELGELEETIGINPPAKLLDEQMDALGDAVIYLCDYAYREDIPLDHMGEWVPTLKRELYGKYPPIVLVGRWCHTTLKWHQGIRGYTGTEGGIRYRTEIEESVYNILAYLDYYAEKIGQDLMTIARTTFDTVVAKRDWKTRPETG